MDKGFETRPARMAPAADFVYDGAGMAGCGHGDNVKDIAIEGELVDDSPFDYLIEVGGHGEETCSSMVADDGESAALYRRCTAQLKTSSCQGLVKGVVEGRGLSAAAQLEVYNTRLYRARLACRTRRLARRPHAQRLPACAAAHSALSILNPRHSWPATPGIKLVQNTSRSRMSLALVFLPWRQP